MRRHVADFVMMTDPFTVTGVIAGGFLMGLAGSLHCAGQCGGIASSLLVATGRGRTGLDRAKALLVTQIGRAITYAISGAIVGLAGGALTQLFDLAGLQPVLRILGAALLFWVGLSLVGVVPGPGVLDRRLVAFSRVISRHRPRAAMFRLSPMPAASHALRVSSASRMSLRPGLSSALFLGMAWGAAPCAMVYNALMTAMLSGSPATGALFMMSFGVATIPAVALTALGAAQIAATGAKLKKAVLRKIIGLFIVALALASMATPAASLAELCLR